MKVYTHIIPNYSSNLQPLARFRKCVKDKEGGEEVDLSKVPTTSVRLRQRLTPNSPNQ